MELRNGSGEPVLFFIYLLYANRRGKRCKE